MFWKNKSEENPTLEIEGIIERCGSQYTPNYGAFVILLESSNKFFSLGPDQYIHPAIFLSSKLDKVKILYSAAPNDIGVHQIKKFENITLEHRLGKAIPRWAYVIDDSRSQ